jgi:hypothetical protein
LRQKNVTWPLVYDGSRYFDVSDGGDPAKYAPAGIGVEEHHVDRLDDVGEREAVTDVRVGVDVTLERFHRIERRRLLQRLFRLAFDHHDQRLHATEELLNPGVRLIVRRIGPQQR